MIREFKNEYNIEEHNKMINQKIDELKDRLIFK